MLNRRDCERLFEVFQAGDPTPTTELNYNSPFELLIAVILSAQATDVAVNQATKRLFQVANTPHDIIQLGTKKLISYIKTIGLYNSKADYIMATCQKLLTIYNGQIPENRTALEGLPGVGRKTANVILNTVFGQPTIAVDTHIFRVANRIGLASGKTVLQVELGLLKAIPRRFQQHAHHWLILHGRYVCTARKPRCNDCPIVKFCKWEDKEKWIIK